MGYSSGFRNIYPYFPFLKAMPNFTQMCAGDYAFELLHAVCLAFQRMGRSNLLCKDFSIRYPPTTIDSTLEGAPVVAGFYVLNESLL